MPSLLSLPFGDRLRGTLRQALKDWRRGCHLVALLSGSLAARSQSFSITSIEVETNGAPRIHHSADATHYFVLLRGSTLSDLNHPTDARLGMGPSGVLSDTTPLASGGFYRVYRVPIEAPFDLDRDGMDDIYELNRAPSLNPLNAADALEDADGDLRANLAEAQAGTDPVRPDFFVVPSPRNHETGVSVNRETVLRFTVPLAAEAMVGNSNLWAEAGGRRLLARTELSTDRRVASLFYLEPIPGATRVRVFFNGLGLRDALDRPLDLDSDGQPGGVAAIEFTTAGFTPVARTAVIGRVFATEPIPSALAAGGDTNRPLEGVTITVDGAEETLRTTTDSEGRFRLEPSPAGRFFVHVDGRTFTNPAEGVRWPDLAYYPFVGKAWEAVAGSTNNLAGGSGEIFLPRIPAGALQTINPVAETVIGFLPEVIAANPALAGVEISIPPNALFDNSGARGGRVGLAPVDPARLPEPLPPGLSFPLVITVQTDGPLNFDQPVPVKFPNLPDPTTGITPGAGSKSALWSFDHDKGTWEIVGPMTVSDDGKFVMSAPGVGIRQPGWHGANPGSGGGGPPPAASPKPRRPPSPPRPPLTPPSPPPPPPPPSPDDPGDEGEPGDDDPLIPDFPEIPDIPFIDEPESWGDLVSTIVDQLPTMGPDVFGPIVDIGKEGIEMFEDLGDVIGSSSVADSDGDGVPDVVESRDEFLQAIEDAAEDQLPSAPENASDASNLLKDWWDIWDELYGSGSRNALRSVNLRGGRLAATAPPVAAVPFLAELQREADDLDRLASLQGAFDAYFRALVGADRWNALSTAGVQFREVLPILVAITTAQRSDSDAGALITAAESNSIVAFPSERIPGALRTEVIARFNFTRSQNALGVVLHSQVSGGSVDFIDATEERAAIARVLAEINAEADAGFATPGDRGLQLAPKMGEALGGFFGAFGSTSPLEPSADNQFPVHLEIFPEGGGVLEQYLHADTLGQLNGLRVPANALVVVRWLDPRTFWTAASFFHSGPPGTRFIIPQSVWNENTPQDDTDGDGLPDAGERIAGTRSDIADTDGDGVGDATEIQSGTNPLDGIVIQAGIAGNADTPGIAVDVAIETYDLSRFGGAPSATRILVADSAAGVAVMELVAGQPILVGQVNTPGDARRVALPQAVSLLVDEVGLAAVADGPAGLAILDLADPVKPRILHQVTLPGVTRCVTVFGGVAYAGGDDGTVSAVDIFSGEILDQIDLGYPIHDMKVSQGVMFVVGPRSSEATLQPLPLLANGLFGSPGTPVGSTGNLSRRGLRLAIGDGLAYVVHGKGYNTWNLTNHLVPVLIAHGNTEQFGWKQIAPDGNGLGVACVGANGSDDGAHDVSLYDLTDPTRTDRLVTTIVTPGIASAVALHGGLAFVADGAFGLQVLNYTGSDRGSNAPTVTIEVTPPETVISGARVTVLAPGADDVLVRSVELYVDGSRIAEDRSWPFEFSFAAPVLSPTKTNITLFARAIDSVGNAASSPVRTIAIVPDTIPPRVFAIQPGQDRTVFRTDATVIVSFDETMDLDSLSSPTVQLFSAGTDGMLGTADDVRVNGGIASYLERANRVVLNFAADWPPGDYRVAVAGSAKDVNGNSLEAPVTSDFKVREGDLRGGETFIAEGSLPELGDQDRYTFLALAGQQIYFNIESGATLGLQWTVEDEAGNEVFHVTVLSDPGVLVLPSTGRYRMVLRRVGSMDPEYRVSLWNVPPPQTFPITVGEIVRDGSPAAGAGNIESPGVEDVYTFTATPGQRVYFDLLAGVTVREVWKLTDDAGAEIFDRAYISDPGVIELTRGGIYTLSFGDRRSDFTGTYSFQLWNVPPPQTFPITVGEIVRDGSPAAGAGNIESPGVEDVYTFTVTPGQWVYFDLLAGATVGEVWKLTDDTGAEIFERAYISDPGVIELTRGGTYTLTFGNRGADFTGTYSFQLWNVPPPQTFPITVGEIVRDGSPAAGAGNIESPGVEDVYTFTATPGQRVYFDLLAGVTVSEVWKLTDDTGAEIFERAYISDPGVIELTRGGTYTLTFGNRGADFTGTYSFQLWNVPPPQTFPITVGEIVRDGSPAAGAGNIESPGVEDVYTFTATPGQRVYFDLLAGVTVSEVWKLTDDTGAEIFERAYISDPGVIELTRGGTYTLTFGNRGADFTGTYSFQLWNVPPPQTFPITVGEIVRDGSPAAGAGNIESPGVEDVYTFTATPGQWVYFDLLAGVTVSEVWKLTDDTGAEIFERAYISDPGVIELTRGGTYTLTFGNRGADFIGTYSFQLWNVPPPQTFPITVGETVLDGSPAAGAGNIESPGVEDVYTFTATPGQRMTFDLLEGVTTAWAWQLTDDTGAGIFDASFTTDQLDITLARGGVYRLTVGNPRSDRVGTYRFQLQPLP